MNPELIYLFLAACAGLLAWGMRSSGRIYEYPFLIGAMFTAFLVPQALALYDNPLGVTVSAIDSAFLMASLCMACAWAGYTVRPLRSVRMRPPRSLSTKRVRTAALATCGISLLATALLPYFPPEGEGGAATGTFTILIFFTGFSVISFPILLIVALERPSVRNLLLALVSSYPIVSAMLLAGRREETAALFIVVAIAIYFVKRVSIGRLPMLAAVFVGAILIPLMGTVRQQLWDDMFSGRFQDIPIEQTMNTLAEGNILELRNAAAQIEAAERTGNYGYGTGYWDALVFRYVPGQLVGFDLKSALQFKWGTDNRDWTGYVVSSGSTDTAMGDTFLQFGFAGCLFFFFQGILFRNLWESALRGSLPSMVAYISLMPAALVSVSHGSEWFLQGGLVASAIIYVTYRYARIAPRRRAASYPNRLGLGGVW